MLSLLLVLSLDIWDFEGASSSSSLKVALLVVKSKLFSLMIRLTIGSALVEEIFIVVLLLGLELISSDVSELFSTLVKVEIAVGVVGVDIVVITGEVLTFAVDALLVRTLLSYFSVELFAEIAMEVFKDMPFDGVCVLPMAVEFMLIVGTPLVVRFLIKVECGDDV